MCCVWIFCIEQSKSHCLPIMDRFRKYMLYKYSPVYFLFYISVHQPTFSKSQDMNMVHLTLTLNSFPLLEREGNK